MKFLGILSTLVLFVGIVFVLPAGAIDDSEFFNSGEFRVRYFNDHAPEYDGANQVGSKRSDVASRFRWNVTVRKSERLQAHLSLIHNAQFGAQNSQNGDFGRVSADGDEATTNNLLLVNRAWGWWKASEAVGFKVGRLGIELADGSVFAENDWEAVPTAHEGLGISVDMEYADVSFFAVKTNEWSLLSADGDPERSFFLVTADIKNLPEMLKVANVHAMQISGDAAANVVVGTSPPADIANENWQHIGFTLGGDFRNILYKVTAAYQNGTFAGDQTINSNMVDVMVGYSLPETMGLKLTLGYHTDTGDDPAAGTQRTYQSLFYDRHNYGGSMDVVRWGNLTYWNVNASMMLQEDVELGAGYYLFTRTQSGTSGNGLSGTQFGERFGRYLDTLSNVAGLGLATGETDLGSELDVFANRAFESGFKMYARLGVFLPGKFLSEGSLKRDETLYQAMLQASMAF